MGNVSVVNRASVLKEYLRSTRDYNLRAAESKGRKPGRPKLEDETLSSVRALVEAGLSPTRAAKQLGIGRSTLYKRLTEEVV
jgi:DNA invertase Pin-like site-specific DNA recombinase